MNKLIPFAVLTLAVVYFYGCRESFDSGSIKGKRVLITGSSSGIGEHLAYEYSKLGAKVFLTARREKLLEKVAEKCKELGAQKVEFVASNLAEQKDRDKVIVEAKNRLGGLDHLILNHAVVSPGLWLGTKENMSTLLSDLSINFLSFVDLASKALPLLTESRGNIGVVSSVTGKIGTAGSSSYSSCKHAVQGFFSSLRQELLLRNTGITVTTCVIGAVDTDIGDRSKEQTRVIREKFFNGYDVVATSTDTAVAIMRGVTNRKYEIYFGRIAWVMVTIHKIFPGYVENFFAKNFLSMINVEL